MNPTTLTHAKQLFLDIKKGLGRKPLPTTVAIAPPVTFLESLHKLNANGRIQLGAQTIATTTAGAETGLVSLPMLHSVGAQFTIIGHSESRARGETDDDVCAKVQLALKQKTPVIVCVGEHERDTEGTFYNYIETQVKAVIEHVPKSKLSLLTFAYEPIWAIGTGNHATAADVEEMKLFLQKVIADTVHRNALKKVRILYGGSVNKKNAAELLAVSGVDGFLVGGASLRAMEFLQIIEIANTYVKNQTT